MVWIGNNWLFGQENQFVQKYTSKTAIFLYKNLSYLILEGSGRQTVNTRLTSAVSLKTLVYNASN